MSEQQKDLGKTEKALPAVANQQQEPEPSRDAMSWEDAFYADVAARLHVARRQRGMRQEDVATEIGISRPSYANIEAGRQRVPVDRLWKIAVVLGVSVSALLPQPRWSA